MAIWMMAMNAIDHNIDMAIPKDEIILRDFFCC